MSLACESLAAQRPDCCSVQPAGSLEEAASPSPGSSDCGAAYSASDLGLAVVITSALTASLLCGCCYAYLRVWARRRRWARSVATSKTVPMNAVACSAVSDRGCAEEEDELEHELDEQRPPGLLSRVVWRTHQSEPEVAMGGAPPPLPPSGAAAKVASPTEWSSSELRALRLALREFPSTMETNDRWRAVRATIPGKTKRQCYDKYRVLREKYREEKSAWGGGTKAVAEAGQ